MYFDWTYLLVIPGLIVAMIAQAKVKHAFDKYAQVRARSGITGAELARQLLASAGITDVTIAQVGGTLSDNYDPSNRVLNLSSDVYRSSSIAALGVTAHECGHAIQHASGYSMLGLRSAIVPVVNIGSNLSWPLFLAGLLFSWNPLILAGIVLFSLTVAFTLVTLPVEFNASNRAIALLESGGYLQSDEIGGAKSVLSAAAMTYVASALSAILQLLRLVLLAGRRNSRD